ncbi:MAG: MGMT family protein [Kiritimatiellae bacterium]|jgi:O-6-methylguanine DNA methyltransferase|nr:MGMT family protein [Kiritimatiellia bacterium]
MSTIYDRMQNHPEITPFRQRVFDALLEVPCGYVTTYGALARRINCGSARAVGGALRHNPLAPEVPCHRVVASDLTIGFMFCLTQHMQRGSLRNEHCQLSTVDCRL